MNANHFHVMLKLTKPVKTQLVLINAFAVMGLFLIQRKSCVSVCIKMHLLIRILLHNEQFHLKLNFDLSKKLRRNLLATEENKSYKH